MKFYIPPSEAKKLVPHIKVSRSKGFRILCRFRKWGEEQVARNILTPEGVRLARELAVRYGEPLHHVIHDALNAMRL